MENNELMGILEQLERDKGIEKKVLIEAVEAAVASAARKLWTVEKDEEIEVVLDPKSGKLRAYADGQEIRSGEFGRIAAQTAKQVVIQKIREAEKEVIYKEYHARIGEIISGGIYRFERGNIIVDLGKAEGQIPRKEQSPQEEFNQGDRVRTYLLAVEKENRGPQIILSRAHPNFVKRLFELEVPEIYEGIVEIKAISRDVGKRTKIGVHSKDERVDSVGACVGMRGSRVKNIVSELQGEKIDIVRYAEDIKEYIQAALAPAEISQIQLDYEGKKANIIVADDQLSLAIGKHGQNVRLASQLVGWELDLFSFEQWDKLNEEEGEETEDETSEAAEGETESAESTDPITENADTDVAEESKEEETKEKESIEEETNKDDTENSDTSSEEVIEEKPDKSPEISKVNEEENSTIEEDAPTVTEDTTEGESEENIKDSVSEPEEEESEPDQSSGNEETDTEVKENIQDKESTDKEPEDEEKN